MTYPAYSLLRRPSYFRHSLNQQSDFLPIFSSLSVFRLDVSHTNISKSIQRRRAFHCLVLVGVGGGRSRSSRRRPKRKRRKAMVDSEESNSKKRKLVEEEVVSMISTTEMPPEGSDSNSNSNPVCPNKKTRPDNSETSVRFKGVVLQQNGHWGAQIYANHQRIWLGTFKSEKAAAMAYDSAAIKLRNADTHRNFPWTSLTIQEPTFQDLHTTDAVLNMIRDGSYESKFLDFVRSQSSNTEPSANVEVNDGPIDHRGMLYNHLFQKELTPSDVGKLNRLVIPKKHAIKYFPHVSETSTGGDENGVDDVQLVFYDKSLRSWKFRYCYWKSSQSYVFTRGWNRFVKEKKLKAKDVITFYTCEYCKSFTGKKSFCMIDIAYSGGSGVGDEKQRPNKVVGKMELQLGMGTWLDGESDEEENKGERRKEEEGVAEKKSVRLFGVQIG